MVVYALLVGLNTSWIIQVSRANLVVKTTCLRKVKIEEFQTSLIQDLRATNYLTRTRHGQHIHHAVGFTYQGRSVRLDFDFSDAGCRAIVEAIHAKFPSIGIQNG